MNRPYRHYLLAALLTGCNGSGGQVLAPPPAEVFAQDEPLPEALPKTIVDVPLLIDFSAAVALMEEALPAKLGNINRRQSIPGKKRAAFAYELWREPFTITVRADTFLIGTTIHYQGKGWYKPPIGPEIGGSCGIKGKEPRARVVVAIRPELNRDWHLTARPRLRMVAPLTKGEQDQCEVSFLKLDVTSKVLGAARSAINTQLPKVGARLATIDVKAEFEKVWRAIQQPIRLADSVWLTLAPEGIRLGHVSGTTEMLGTTIGIDARPRIETGPKPVVAEQALPPLESPAPATGLSLLVEGRFDYQTISGTLSKALVGKQIKAPGGMIEIQEIRAFGIGGNRVALGVRFDGTTAGQIYFVGTPQFDSSTGRIVVPDLDYDASTAGLLVQSLAWLKAADIRDYLRAKATFPSAETLERITTLAAKGMNRELTRGISLSASTDHTDVIRILARADAIVLQARATGQATLLIDHQFFRRFAKTPAPSGSDTTPSDGAQKTANPAR